MKPLDLQVEVFLVAFVAYAVIVLVVTLCNARTARRDSSRVDETGPGGHVFHERRAQALVGQVFGGDR
jgi:hypothetical protein